jgi:hypothetical protein
MIPRVAGAAEGVSENDKRYTVQSKVAKAKDGRGQQCAIHIPGEIKQTAGNPEDNYKIMFYKRREIATKTTAAH